ncbi:MAG: DUF3800 domain-containing protein, partial [Oscillospiraceae bacterium]|nr:DUF3800 domain-containing protein [Oscillospiraceae bacterium]
YLSKEEKDIAGRKYASAEKTIRSAEEIEGEVKAAKVSNSSKNKLYRSLNNTHKFALVIHQQDILPKIFEQKKSKQRYLDYAYKIAVKRKFEKLIKEDIIDPDEVENLYFYVDEHTTATNGKYELRESIEQEFRFGTFNIRFDKFFPPLFPHLKNVSLDYCNSATKRLVRAADIVANRVYYSAIKNQLDQLVTDHMFITHLP